MTVMLETYMHFETWTRERVIAHWEAVLARTDLPHATLDAAKQCLMTLRGWVTERPVPVRVPGEDDQ